jgi:hypothetical protein
LGPSHFPSSAPPRTLAVAAPASAHSSPPRGAALRVPKLRARAFAPVDVARRGAFTDAQGRRSGCSSDRAETHLLELHKIGGISTAAARSAVAACPGWTQRAFLPRPYRASWRKWTGAGVPRSRVHVEAPSPGGARFFHSDGGGVVVRRLQKNLNRDQSDSRRASAAACRRALTSPSSRAARSMRSC